MVRSQNNTVLPPVGCVGELVRGVGGVIYSHQCVWCFFFYVVELFTLTSVGVCGYKSYPLARRAGDAVCHKGAAGWGGPARVLDARDVLSLL